MKNYVLLSPLEVASALREFARGLSPEGFDVWTTSHVEIRQTFLEGKPTYEALVELKKVEQDDQREGEGNVE